MSYAWHADLRPSSLTAAAVLPPANLGESAWDVLLILHSDDCCRPTLEKLAALASLSERALNGWLALLEERQLIIRATTEFDPQVRAVLTAKGRALLDGYLSAATELQLGSGN